MGVAGEVLVGIYGASGFGREVLPLITEHLTIDGHHAVNQCVFIDDSEESSQINGHLVKRFDDFLGLPFKKKRVVVAIADSKIRQKLFTRCEQFGIDSWPVQAKNALILGSVNIGAGAILCPFVCLTTNIQIGKGFHANIYSYVGHDCVIGDFVTFAPSVKCNGNVHIHDHAYIGTGAMLRQGTPDKPLIIGEGAVVGMGAVVTKDVAPHTVVVGNPARPLK